MSSSFGRRSKPRFLKTPAETAEHLKRFIRRRVGKRFWVTPPWLTPPKFRSRQVITIEPGMAFGTGTHATTRGCLEFIEQVAVLLPGSKWTALDIGTGSGILAIALVKLGAKKIWAIDNDPVALVVAKENLRINGVDDKVFLSTTALRLSINFPGCRQSYCGDDYRARRRPGQESQPAVIGLSGHPAYGGCGVAPFRAFQCRRKRAREWVTLLLRRR
jgi:SAM-dependent methyltransferase